jgi:hypothetical protein
MSAAGDEGAVFALAGVVFGLVGVLGFAAWKCCCAPRKQRLSPGGWALCAFVIVSLGAAAGSLWDTAQQGATAVFDPYEILQLEDGASSTRKQIRKAYKQLALQHHPDKFTHNPTAAEAAMKFTQFAKAHAALTEPRAMENFERFGHPDGRRSMEISVGLPSWLWADEFAAPVMALYMCIVLLLPLLLWGCAKRTAPKQGVSRSTLQQLHAVQHGQDAYAAATHEGVLAAVLAALPTALPGAGLGEAERLAVRAALRTACASSGWAEVEAAEAAEAGETAALLLLSMHRKHAACAALVSGGGLSPDTCVRIDALAAQAAELLDAWKAIALQSRRGAGMLTAATDWQARLLDGFGGGGAGARLLSVGAKAAVFDDGEQLAGINPRDLITLQVDVKWPAAEAACSDGGADVLLLVEANGQTIAALECAPPLREQRKISKQFQFGAPDAPGVLSMRVFVRGLRSLGLEGTKLFDLDVTEPTADRDRDSRGKK